MDSTAPRQSTVYRRGRSTAIDLFAAHDDDQALFRACWLSYLTSMTVGRSGAARDAIDRLSDPRRARLSHPWPAGCPGC